MNQPDGFSDEMNDLELAQVRWYPPAAVGKDFPDVPEEIASTANEASANLSIGHFRSAAILARAVVEAITKHKQATGKNLQEKIDKLHSMDLIRGHTRDAAHEIRYLGNEVAHGDLTDPVEADEANDILIFMEEILEEVYQGPARLDRRKSKRLAKKAVNQPTTVPST